MLENMGIDYQWFVLEMQKKNVALSVMLSFYSCDEGSKTKSLRTDA